MRLSIRATPILVIVALLAPVASARAQDAEVAAGISWSWIEGDYARWHMYQGWSLEVARSLTPHLGITGEADGNYYSLDYSNGWSESHRVFIFAVGPKLTTSRNNRVIEFAQLLVGMEHFSATLHTPPDPDFNGSSSEFAIEPGGGVDVRLTRRVAVRARVAVAIADPWHATFWQLPLWRLGLSGVYKW
jgi:hypothetical protein